MLPKACSQSCADGASRSATRRSNAGFSIVEMLIALVIALGLVAAAMSVAFAGRWVLDADRVRTNLNQNLRSGMDLIGIDVKQAGERLPSDVPAVEILDGDAGAPDRLIVRRNLHDQVLPLCAGISSGSSVNRVVVAKNSGSIPSGCTPVDDLNGDNWPDNLESWRDRRQQSGGSLWAYLYNPTSHEGEFFLYYAENETEFYLEKANGESWQYDYDVADQARVYILEQREFRLNNGTLQCIINGVDVDPFNLVDELVDFQARGYFQDGSDQDAVGVNDSWAELHSIEVRLRGRDEIHDKDMNRELVTRFFPRNVLSR